MTTPTNDNHNKSQEANGSPAENQQRIDAHKKIAGHLETAAKHHHEAANFHKENKNEEAAKSARTAHEHLTLANETEKKESALDAVDLKK
jgi:hypothetical protein